MLIGMAYFMNIWLSVPKDDTNFLIVNDEKFQIMSEISIGIFRHYLEMSENDK